MPFQRYIGLRKYLYGNPGADPGELLLQESGHLVAAGGLRHLEECSKFYSLRMWFYLLRLWREDFGRPLEQVLGPERVLVHDPGMRVHYRGPFEVFQHRLLPHHVPAPQLHLYPGPALLLPHHEVVPDHFGSVPLGIQHQFDLIRHVLVLHLRSDDGRSAGRELSVHDRSRYPQPLLSPGLPQAVESRTVQKPSEDMGDLFLHYPRAVVLDYQSELVSADLLYLDEDLGQYLGLLTHIQRVVHRFLHGCDHRPGEAVKTKYVLVPLEELRDRYLLLLLGQFLSD